MGMKHWTLLAAPAAALMAAPALAAASPNLPGCPAPEQPDSGERQRKGPLPVPAALRAQLRSSLYHYAIASRAGPPVCVDTSWIESIDGMALSPDGRFLTFRWIGYETYGYLLIDRAGRGKAHEIGARPVFSPSRGQFAAIDQTESEFGSLSGLKVWRVTPTAVTEAGKVEDIPRMYDWRIDAWLGEACLNLSAVPLEQADDPKAQRRRYVARIGPRGWRVSAASPANRCPA